MKSLDDLKGDVREGDLVMLYIEGHESEGPNDCYAGFYKGSVSDRMIFMGTSQERGGRCYLRGNNLQGLFDGVETVDVLGYDVLGRREEVETMSSRESQ